MHKRLLVGLFSAFMAMAPWCGYAAQTGQTVDAPHVNVDSNGTTEDCTYCHFANFEPGDCNRCHKNGAAPYGDGTAPVATTHRSLKCQACHNPHVSLQAAGTITGGFTGVTVTNGMSTLTGVSPTPDPSWAAKTGEQRGLIMWVDDTWDDGQGHTITDKASFEIKSVSGNTVTVKGDMSAIEGRTFDLRRGQLIAKHVSRTVSTDPLSTDGTYRQKTLTVPPAPAEVQFPAQGTNPFVDGTGTGICQVCHENTNYWRNDGSRNTHNATLECTGCHKHASGFQVTGCTACHTGKADDGVPTTTAELAKPATGSATAGAHAVHARFVGSSGYNFDCGVCHNGTGMDRINAPNNVVSGDGIQIGFNVPKYAAGTFWLGALSSYNGQSSVIVPYVGKNYTTVTNSGVVGGANLTCSNVYCHSNGKAVRLGCKVSTTSTSPAWDWDGSATGDPQSDTVKCNNCHGFEKTNANVMLSGRHETHVKTYNVSCYTCHADTVSNDGTGHAIVTNKANHTNGNYDIKGSGIYAGQAIVLDKNIASGSGMWNPTAKTCIVVCHQNQQKTWAVNPTVDTETCPDKTPTCASLALSNLDPVMAFTTDNVDDRTLKLIDTSVDPDRIDPMKNWCLNGGHDAATWGYIKVTTSDPKMGNQIVMSPLDGTPVNSLRTYPTSQIDLVTDPAAPRVWFTYKVADNDPLTTTNMGNGTRTTTDGFVDSGWQAHVMKPVDMTHMNALPNIDYTVSATRIGTTNTYTFKFTDMSIDPDANDPAKTALFGGGHDGSVGRGKLLFNDGTSVNNNSVPFGTTPSNTVFSKVVTGTPGQQIWYSYTIWDNHYRNTAAQTASPTTSVDMGWKFYTLP